MEETESEQLIQFIRGSHERIKEAFMYIEGDNVPAAAYCLGQLDTLHATLLDVCDDDVCDDDVCDDEEQEACCSLQDCLNSLRDKCK